MPCSCLQTRSGVRLVQGSCCRTVMLLWLITLPGLGCADSTWRCLSACRVRLHVPRMALAAVLLRPVAHLCRRRHAVRCDSMVRHLLLLYVLPVVLLLLRVLLLAVAARAAQQALIKDLICTNQKVICGVQPMVPIEEIDRAWQGTHAKV